MKTTNIISNPHLNETICLKIAGEWAVCGPRFFAQHGRIVRTVERYANGSVRYCNRNVEDVRILRDGELCAIAAQPEEVPCDCGASNKECQWWGSRTGQRMFGCAECALAAHIRGEIQIENL